MHVVTVSRQLGSLGDVIAAIVARSMGYKLIGPDQVRERANVCDPEYKDACSVYESEKGPGFWERFFFDTPSFTALFKSLTYEFASQGHVVIVGRGSQLVLRDVPGVFSVRIVAPKHIRVDRIAERYGVSKEAASDIVRKHDRERRAMMQSIFDHDDRDWALYDVVLNTTHYAADAGAEVVIKAAQNMTVEPEPEDLLAKLAAMATAKRLETVIKKRLTPGVAWQVEVTGEAGGRMILSGRVGDKRYKDKAGDIAKEFPDVSSVENELKVTELSFGY
ncbi:MAG: cytidylate kinase family protein [Desulfomonilaceae bacterium]|nr:cytidylate kinase family protein [Desulfomonilaceae bacterium]